MKKLLTSIVAGLSLLSLTACGGNSTKNGKDTSLTAIQEKGVLVVAMSPDYAPFEFKTLVDGKDTVVGADVELAKAIAGELGVDVKFETMSFNNVLASLQSGKADIAISGLSATAEREKVYDFSDVYYAAQNVILIPKSKIASYTSTDDFNGKSVGAQQGSVQEPIVKEQLTGSRLISIVQLPEMVTQLKSGKLDAVVMEEAIAKGYVDQNDDLAIANLSLKETSDEPGSSIAMKKGSKALKDKINEIVKTLKADGKIDQFVQEANELAQSAEEN